jgi:hypothetical protein
MRLVISGLYLRSMKRWVPVFSFLSFMAILIISHVSHKTVSRTIYSVSGVKRMLRHAPKYLSGRTPVVRGNLYSITTCCTSASGPQNHCLSGSVTQIMPALPTGWQFVTGFSSSLPPRVDATRTLIVLTSSRSYLASSTAPSSFQLGPLLFIRTEGAVYRIRLLSVQACKKSSSGRPCSEAVVL